MTITALPLPPSRQDPTNFSERADAFMAALPAFATETNATAVDVDADAVSAAASAVNAAASAAGANASANVSKWVSGTTYAEGDVEWSPINFFSYRRKIAGAGTTDPSADPTNWALVSGAGDVSLTGVQTLTNKTLVAPVLGTPASGNLVNCTFPTLNQSTTGNAATATSANGGYFTAASTNPRLEFHKTGVLSGQWSISSTGTYVLQNTNGAGVSGGDVLSISAGGVMVVASGRVTTLGDFVKSTATSGYQKLPDGIIIQWGSINLAPSATVVTLPIAFPTQLNSVVITARGSQAAATSTSFVSANTASTITIDNRTGVTTFFNYIVIGY